ncbi:MAG TPA: DUF6263 family protein [Planctomycetaceae bacterium]|nr:DUF6263 family protein [Planctomycetaceae bacterium]
MNSRRIFCTGLLLFALGAVSGCEYIKGLTGGAEADDDLTDLGGADVDLNTGSALPPSDTPQASLELNVKAGDRFPLLKTVEQTLVQVSPQGEVRSTTSLELLMSLTVDEVATSDDRSGQKRLSVRYHRVRYQQDLAGQRLSYNSEAPPNPLPPGAEAYHGLVGNGFFVWVGANNQIVEAVGFREFLERCVRHVPPERQMQVRSAVTSTTGIESVVNFLDDSIGILPAEAVKVGDNWSQTRQISEPLRMNVALQYNLEKLDDSMARIAVLGTISPAAGYASPAELARGLTVNVRGGQIFGTCGIDRRTGLPLQSRVEQVIDMKVAASGGPEFEQRKQTVTTIQAFPDSGAPASAGNQGGAGTMTLAPPGALPEGPAAALAPTSNIAGPSEPRFR